MIPSHTPPGAEIICIDDAPGEFGAGGLVKGAVYTLARIELCVTGGFGVILREIPPWETYAPPWGLVTVGFDPRRFRLLELPRCLTELLETQPAAPERVV
jgi:hypothetical protein